MGDPGSKLPKVCPACGGINAYRKQYETGGGWRPVYRCVDCGRRHTPTTGER
jgi:transposase-like protein